jgi:predicted DNA-binding transcriptional regulator AlpA
MLSSKGTFVSLQEQPALLSSWKEIANYTGKGVRTVQRWERDLGLPVRRPTGGNARKGPVLLYRADMDAWMETRLSVRPRALPLQEVFPAIDSCDRVCGILQQGIRTTRELRTTSRMLAAKIELDAALVAGFCDPLTTLTVEVSWCISVSSDDDVRSKGLLASADGAQTARYAARTVKSLAS